MFEYICGGGFVGQPLPPSLAAEGGMMLEALLADLLMLDGVELCVPMDARCAKPDLPNGAIVTVGPGQDLNRLLADLLTDVDLFWPIAPETDGILQSLVELAGNANVQVLASNTDTLAICANKWQTCRALARHSIPAVETRYLDAGGAGLGDEVVIKIADGVGCADSRVIGKARLPAAIAEFKSPRAYVMQPYLKGQPASLSCLFKHGQAWLLCYNHQQIDLHQGRFALRGCLVNAPSSLLNYYRDLLSKIAAALPGLWGYVGVDIIEHAALGPLVLEINPRLTTSYTGIRRATGINVAEQVLRLMDGDPLLNVPCNQPIQISIP